MIHWQESFYAFAFYFLTLFTIYNNNNIENRKLVKSKLGKVKKVGCEK